MLLIKGKLKILIKISLLIIAIYGCTKTSSSYQKNMADDFNFVSEIRDNSYIINTYNNTLTKALDWEKDTVIPLKLVEKEKERIYTILKEIDIYKYPENYAPTSTTKIFPSFSYNFKFTINKIDYQINWIENTESEMKEAQDLLKLFNEILALIENNEKVKNLPESKRVFL